MDQDGLRSKAREAIQSGRLPDRSPDRSWAGPGSGCDCTVCGEALIHDEYEFELEFGTDLAHAGPVTFRMHVRCFDAWEVELPRAQKGRQRSLTDEDSLLPSENAGTMTGREHPGTDEREHK